MAAHKDGDDVDLSQESIKALTDAQPSPLDESLELSIKRVQEDSALQQLVAVTRSAVLRFYNLPADSHTAAAHRKSSVNTDKSRRNSAVRHKSPPQRSRPDDDGAALVYEVNAFLSDVTLLRALRSRKWDPKCAIELLVGTVEWRRSHVPRAYSNPMSLACSACADDSRTHSFDFAGLSTNKRPIMFTSISQFRSLEVEAVCRHIYLTIERVFVVAAADVHPQWVWVLDISGFSLRHVSVGLARALIEIFAKHYCERLSAVLVVNASSAFHYLWGVVSRMLEKHKQDKVKFTKSIAEFHELLTAMIDNKSTIDWLEAAQGARVAPPLPPDISGSNVSPK